MHLTTFRHTSSGTAAVCRPLVTEGCGWFYILPETHSFGVVFSKMLFVLFAAAGCNTCETDIVSMLGRHVLFVSRGWGFAGLLLMLRLLLLLSLVYDSCGYYVN